MTGNLIIHDTSKDIRGYFQWKLCFPDMKIMSRRTGGDSVVCKTKRSINIPDCTVP